MKARASYPVPAAGTPRHGFDPRSLVLPIVALCIVEALALAYLPPDSYSFAAPHQIAVAFMRQLFDGTFFAATLQTLESAVGGLAVGGTLGLLVGLLLGLSPTLDRLMNLSIETLRPIPPAALIPLSLLIYGFGFRMEVTIVAFTTLWPVLVLTRAAIRATELGLMEVARVLQLGLVKRSVAIVLPAALPRIFVAFRLSAAISLIVAVTVEVVANPIGLGYGMMLAAQSLHPAESFAFLVWIGIVGWLFNGLFILIERRFFLAFREQA